MSEMNLVRRSLLLRTFEGMFSHVMRSEVFIPFMSCNFAVFCVTWVGFVIFARIVAWLVWIFITWCRVTWSHVLRICSTVFQFKYQLFEDSLKDFVREEILEETIFQKSSGDVGVCPLFHGLPTFLLASLGTSLYPCHHPCRHHHHHHHPHARTQIN